ncbi:MAG: MBL fold metallo-hydrolase [Clostridia bacterium]|nr:MBL fold metallo-hydrolase [Clostridia bacterium]
MKVKVLIENTSVSPALVAEHGLGLYIEANGRRLLFDSGQSGVIVDNAAAMGVDLSSVDTAILSHGHYDHGGGMLRFLSINSTAPLYINRHAFGEYYNASEKYIGLDPALATNDRAVTVDRRADLGPWLELFDLNGGKLKYPINPFGLTKKAHGSLVPDDFIHEQYLLIEEKGRRVFFSGCSHKGILNIMDAVRPDVFIGGFHLSKLDPECEGREELERIAAELLFYPCNYYTCHCTGDAQGAFLESLMGGRLRRISTGNEFEM